MTATEQPRKINWQRRLVTVVTVGIFSVGSAALLFLLVSDSTQQQQQQQQINYESNVGNHHHDGSQHGFPPPPPPGRRRLGEDCEKTCKDPPLKDYQHFDGNDLMDYSKMLERLKFYRKSWVTKQLHKDYGKMTYLNLFEPEEDHVRHSVGRNRIFKDVNDLPQYVAQRQKEKEEQEKAAASEGGEGGETKTAPAAAEEEPVGHPGWERLVTKMQMKILQTQLGIINERENAKAICIDECGTSDEAGGRHNRFLKATPKSTGLYTKFTWATGGHSASAGHGNFFRESYTANLKRALKPLLKEIGIDFEARNYAMGGTDCAEEIALCMNSIFGRDFDAISWDYGMTDGHELYKMLMYAYKAAGLSQLPDGFSQPGNVPHRPAFFAIHQNDRNNQVVKGMHDLGMTALSFDGKYMKEVVYDALPDMQGMKDDAIAKLPPYVQYFKCGGGIEVGDPGCKDNKFNNTICDKRRARTSWHPGWKDHALKGNLIAMTILDALEDAIESLMEMKSKDTKIPADESLNDTKLRLVKQLQDMDGEEKKRYDNIFSQPIPENLMNHVKGWWNEGRDEHLSGVDIEDFYKQPSFCHSAILPSQARFQGLVTENFTKVGEIEDQNYDEGIPSSLLYGTERPGRRTGAQPAPFVNPAGEGKLMMIRDDGMRQACEDHLNLDFKDFFYISSMEGQQSFTIPNDSEKKFYTEFDGKKAKGYVLLCMVRCDWGRCPEGDLHNYFGWMRPKVRQGETAPTEDEIRAKWGTAEVLINGEAVTEAADLRNCFALRNKNGPVWKPNAQGRYEIKIQVKGGTDYSFIRPASFILV